MAKTTQHQAEDKTSPAWEWCNYHRGSSQTAKLLVIIEAGSGPGGGVYACAPCRTQHGLVALDEQ